MHLPLSPSVIVEHPELDTLETIEVSVGDIAHTRVLSCPPDLPVHEAARRMTEAGVSSIVVVDGERAIGIWTERDTLAVDFSDPGCFGLPVRSVMSTPVRAVQRSLPLKELAIRFRDEHVRHYLVVDEDGRHCGIVSQTDVVLNQGVEHYLKLRKLDSVIRGRLRPLAPTAALVEATRRMREEGVDAVVVRYADHDYGILTERDVARLVAARAGERPIGELATRPLLTVHEHTSLYRVRCLLADHRIRHIGVLREDGSLADLVSFADILSGMELVYVHELQHALRQRDQALSASRRDLMLAEKVIESSLDGILITDANARIISVNPAFTRLTGYTPEEAIGQTPAILGSGRHDAAFYEAMWASLDADGYWQGEVWNRRKNGELYPELLTITAITDRDGRVSHYAALFSDISHLKESEARIRDLAYFDPLTGLPNRRLLEDRLQVALAHAHRNDTLAGVMFIDLDRFKRINDSLGHEVGDQLLVEAARRLSACLREDDTVARMGGDEFLIVLGQLASPDDAAHVATRVIDSLRQPILVGGHELVVTTSVGVSIYPDDGEDAAELVKHADVAMYRAKDEGRNRFQLYQPTMNAQSMAHLSMESDLRQAVTRGELVLHYQPLRRVADGVTVAAEALVRWQRPGLGLIPPQQFIPLAEETGLILSIGEWVLRTACRQHLQWREAGLPPLQMMVNISVRQFHDRDFADMVARVLAESAMPAAYLTLEITESMLMDNNAHSLQLLERLRALGVRIAIDDFGTGYSSLGYLKTFPIDELKMDRIFIGDIDHNARDAAIAAAIVTLAHSLGLQVVAEGVETAAQLEILAANGCDLAQGFLFARPLPADQFAAGC